MSGNIVEGIEDQVTSDITNSEVMRNLDHLKQAVKLMADNSGLSLEQIVERFRESWAFIAAGFEAFEGTDIGAGDAVRLMKEMAVEETQMLKDLERTLLYGMMYIVTPWGEDQEEALKNYVPEILETVGFIYTVMGDKFFQYVLKRRTQGLKASVDKMRKIIIGTDDKLLIKGLNMPDKDGALLEMVEAKEEIFQSKIEKKKLLPDATADDGTHNAQGSSEEDKK